jgi:hypothetical protein
MILIVFNLFVRQSDFFFWTVLFLVLLLYFLRFVLRELECSFYDLVWILVLRIGLLEIKIYYSEFLSNLFDL